MKKDLYFQIFSIHGLLRYRNMELGRDADTGGQIKYVVELAETLSQMENVRQVDLFTRLISDKRVSSDYSRPVEKISDRFRIIRIQCGGKQYMRKELLWPHLDEFIDKTIKFIKREGRKPDIVHGHYPDAGYVGIALSEFFGTAFVYTGHSMGRVKKQKLLDDGMSSEEINKKYSIDQRIAAEEEALKNADLIITSTRQEIEKQYGMYRNNALPKFAAIPPGINLNKFYPFYHDMMHEAHKDEESIMAHASVLEELNRFFMHPEKPLILAICRADKRKNITGLVEAYGSDKELQAMANLAVFAGIRKNIAEMEENEKNVLTEMLLDMDKYDLYGKLAIPKRHDFTYEVPELYRIVGEKKGVFVNVALTEPFGLTLIEASACGVPIVATNDGGPRDIMENCKNGILVDPRDKKKISEAVKSIIVDNDQWKTYSNNGIKGVNTHYNWKAHAEKYMDRLETLLPEETPENAVETGKKTPVGDRLTRIQAFLITDIDDTLTGDPKATERLMDILRSQREGLGFGVATGRSIESAMKVFQECNLIEPDVIISSAGTEMYYRKKSFQEKGWQAHIAKRWNRRKIREALDGLNFLNNQEEEHQRPFKISYYLEHKKGRLPKVHEVLSKTKIPYNLIYSDGQFLDILPYRGSKGKAIRYLSYKWEIPLQNILVSGDSGSDKEMLISIPLAAVVSNHDPALDELKGKKNIFFSEKPYADGLIDGMNRYHLLERAKG